MIKKLSIAVGVLLGLVVVAAIAVSFVDVNYFKPQIAGFVADRYKRTLTFEGDLKLTLFPSVGGVAAGGSPVRAQPARAECGQPERGPGQCGTAAAAQG